MATPPTYTVDQMGIQGFLRLRRRKSGVQPTNLVINSEDDFKPVLINSRDFGTASGTNEAMQVKPNLSVGAADASITGAEFSPRVADGQAASQMRAITASPFLKGTTGNLGSNVIAVEAEFSLGSNSTRTVTGGIWALRTILDCAGTMTVTGKKSIIRVDNPLAAADWDYLVDLGSSSALLAAKTSAAVSHIIPIRKGSTNYWIMVSDQA